MFTTEVTLKDRYTTLVFKLKKFLGIKPREYILCAAIWYNDGKEYVHQPKNIHKGIVIAGRRHHNCFITLYILKGKGNYDANLIEQGFITSFDRYVSRSLAYCIAKKAGQLFSGLIHDDNPILISEELY